MSTRHHTVLNGNNVLLTNDTIINFLKKGGISVPIHNLENWQNAFVHKSYISDKNNINSFSNSDSDSDSDTSLSTGVVPLQPYCNERLEWLGDAQLQAAVTHYLWERYPDQDEGFLTKLRSKLVKTQNLSFLARKLGFSKYLIISRHVEFTCYGRTNPRILENTFEAFIGAMYIDFIEKKNRPFAYEVICRFIQNVIEKYVDITEMVLKDDNYKDQLMWLFQKTYNGAFPVYLKEKKENDQFFIYVKDPESEKIVGRGVARSKKKAEQQAAKNALQYYAKKSGLKNS